MPPMRRVLHNLPPSVYGENQFYFVSNLLSNSIFNSNFILDWDRKFAKRTLAYYKIIEMRYFKWHLAQFFAFYQEFDFDELLVFPNSGEPVAKKNYAIQSALQK